MPVYYCLTCNPTDDLPPCVCVLPDELGAPVGCLYGRLPDRTRAEWRKIPRSLTDTILAGIDASTRGASR